MNTLHCVRALFPLTQSFVLGFQGEKVAKMTLLKLLNRPTPQLWINMTQNQHIQAAAESISLWGRKKVLPQLDFLPFFGHFSGYLAPPEVRSGSSLCRDQPDSSIPHPWSLCVCGGSADRALTLRNRECLFLTNLWLCVFQQSHSTALYP